MIVGMPWPSSRDKELKLLLKTELVSAMGPHLASLGFTELRSPKSRAKFLARNHYRVSGQRIDILDFQWALSGWPAFIINFRVQFVPDGDPLDVAMRELWFNAMPCRAGSGTCIIERWFHIGYLDRLFHPKTAAKREVRKAFQRIDDIDRYARTGQTSPFLRDISVGRFGKLPSRS